MSLTALAVVIIPAAVIECLPFLQKYVPSAQRKKDQAVVDGMVMSVIRKREDKKMLFGYLGTTFGLRNKMYPHRLKF